MNFLIKAYFFLAGKKTYTGVALHVLGAALASAGKPDLAHAVTVIGDGLAAIGLADKAARTLAGQE